MCKACPEPSNNMISNDSYYFMGKMVGSQYTFHILIWVCSVNINDATYTPANVGLCQIPALYHILKGLHELPKTKENIITFHKYSIGLNVYTHQYCEQYTRYRETGSLLIY